MNGYTDQTYRVFELVFKPDPDKVGDYVITWSNGEKLNDGRMSVPAPETRRAIVSFKNELGKDIVLEFYGQTWDRSRCLKLCTHNHDPIEVAAGATTEIVVQSFADIKGSQRFPDGVTWENEHVYRVRGMRLAQPGPGIIVCPPGQNPPCT